MRDDTWSSIGVKGLWAPLLVPKMSSAIEMSSAMSPALGCSHCVQFQYSSIIPLNLLMLQPYGNIPLNLLPHLMVVFL